MTSYNLEILADQKYILHAKIKNFPLPVTIYLHSTLTPQNQIAITFDTASIGFISFPIPRIKNVSDAEGYLDLHLALEIQLQEFRYGVKFMGLSTNKGQIIMPFIITHPKIFIQKTSLQISR